MSRNCQLPHSLRFLCTETRRSGRSEGVTRGGGCSLSSRSLCAVSLGLSAHSHPRSFPHIKSQSPSLSLSHSRLTSARGDPQGGFCGRTALSWPPVCAGCRQEAETESIRGPPGPASHCLPRLMQRKQRRPSMLVLSIQSESQSGFLDQMDRIRLMAECHVQQGSNSICGAILHYIYFDPLR